MVLGHLFRGLAMLLLLSLNVSGAAAEAHKNHQQERVEAAESAKAPQSAPASTPGAMQGRMEEHIEAMEHQRPKSFPGRLVTGLGAPIPSPSISRSRSFRSSS